MKNLADNVASRSLLEITLGFVGALLILPLIYRVVVGVLAGLFRFRPVRKIAGEVIFVGLTALLTHEGVLDRLFGRKGETGDGLLKPRVND